MNDVTPDEFALVQILSNPVMFREFINEGDPNWNPLEDHERAWTTSQEHYIAMCCGRSVHKTTTMIEMLYYWMINNMFIVGDQGLFVLVPNKAQKDLSFFRIRSACVTHWLIKHFVSPNDINVTEGKINFINGFQFLMRLAGEAGKESNVIGLHTYRIWVDEAQDIPWRTWLSLQNCLKVEIPGYQMIVSGVPSGVRKENVLYECDELDEKYSSYNIAQTMMSWWTPELELNKRREYHAILEDSEDYKHYVLGQHGMPSYSVFDRARMLREDYPLEKVVLTQHMFDGCKRLDPDGVERYHVEELVQCPSLPTDFGYRPLVGIGYDVGFSPDPTCFYVMYQEKNQTWRNITRIVLQRVEYALQRELFAWLDKVYHFDFLGIDMGGPGKVQYQDLTSELSPYTAFKFKERIYPVEFGGYLTVAIDEQGVEKKDQTKRVAVETTSRWVHEHRLSFSTRDENMMEELERTKFTRTITGEPVYRTDDDHQMAALMCAIMAYEHRYGPPVVVQRGPISVKLMSARWMDPTQPTGV